MVKTVVSNDVFTIELRCIWRLNDCYLKGQVYFSPLHTDNASIILNRSAVRRVLNHSLGGMKLC